KEYAIIAINGTGRIREALEQIRQRNDVLFVEVMACPGGCLFGGGQVRIKDEPTAKARLKALTDAQTLHERPALKDAGPLSALLSILNETDKMYLYGRSFHGKEEA
ncbi:MAG: hypothetical protein IH599_01480, partial [Bacteroidales bacterium]|nr:hypothetical protein [Bacteroidales bacterium]